MSSKSVSIFLLSCQLFLLIGMINSSTPPENPIKCSSTTNRDCTITNALGEFPDKALCKVSTAVYPKTEQELISAVAMASMKNIKVKVATRYYLSQPKLVCPDQSQNGNLLISTRHLDRVLSIDRSAMTMTVESGILLRDLVAEAAKVGMALPTSPDWWSLTLGGMISTGAHGSSLSGDGSYVHDYVTGLRIVTPASSDEGYAKVRVLDNNHPDMKAVKLSLGVLGVIAQVTLKLEPLSRRSITIVRKNDSDLATMASTFGSEHEFGEITWYPYHRKALYRLDDRVVADASGNGLIDFIGFHSTSTQTLEKNLQVTDDATVTTLDLATSGYGFTNDGNLFTGYPVGYQNRLPASGSYCLDAQTTTCEGHPRTNGRFYHLTSVNLPLSKVKKFIEDVQKLRDIVPQAFAGLELENGILMRYIKGSNVFLGTQEDSLEFDISYIRGQNTLSHRRFQDILEEVEQTAVFRYGGIPHWGKNRNVGFINVINKYRHAREFLKVRESYDPSGVFSSKWTDQILGLDQSGVAITEEGCAMEGLCVCSEDIHCAPKQGYVCLPGRINRDARVCRDIKEKDLGLSDM